MTLTDLDSTHYNWPRCYIWIDKRSHFFIHSFSFSLSIDKVNHTLESIFPPSSSSSLGSYSHLKGKKFRSLKVSASWMERGDRSSAICFLLLLLLLSFNQMFSALRQISFSHLHLLRKQWFPAYLFSPLTADGCLSHPRVRKRDELRWGEERRFTQLISEQHEYMASFQLSAG